MIENRSGKKLRILETSERSREVSKMAAERTEPDKVVPRPNPEVAARATRRRFSARYKLRILEQADGCESGEVGALLRREGLYWSNLQAWRQQREHGTLQALTPRKRGRKSKPVNPLDRQLKRVEAENRKLKRKLEKFEAMLDLQKKVSIYWESLWRAAKRTERELWTKLCDSPNPTESVPADLPPVIGRNFRRYPRPRPAST